MIQTLGIEKIQEFARQKGGECLSTEYINYKTKLKWRCDKRHIWYSIPYNIITRGYWCPECGNKNMINHRIGKTGLKTLKFAQSLAKRNDGVCLSDTFINMRNRLKWRCNKDGNEWMATTNNIQQGQWCPECGNKNKQINNHGSKRRLSLDYVKDIIASKNGKCKSNKYINAKTKLLIHCNICDEEWRSNISNIKFGRWCPTCASCKTEKMCKKYLEEKTGFKFLKCRPKWLRGLELDGYCKELHLAFEYNGVQHYRFHSFFHNNEEEFLEQQKNDNAKEEICKIKNIQLIKIPYTLNDRSPIKIYRFIDERLLDLPLLNNNMITIQNQKVYKPQNDEICMVENKIDNSQIIINEMKGGLEQKN